MNRKRLVALLASTSLVLLPAAAGYATETDLEATQEQTAETTEVESTETEQVTAQAPAEEEETTDSEAEAVAIDVNDGTVRVAGTGASTADEGSADATTLGLGGETVIGGSQEGEGEQSGEVLDTGETELGRLAIAPWETTVEENRSHAETSILYAELIDSETALVRVLHSESEATEEGSESSTTGATVDAGDGGLHLVLLHAQTTSEGEGSSYVASINGEKIISSEQAEGECVIPADPLIHVTCVTASETGEGRVTGATAEVADVAALDDNVHVDAFESGSEETEGGATAGEQPTDDTDGVPDDQPAEQPAPPAGDSEVLTASAQPAPDEQGALPRTGAGLLLALPGLAAIGLGAGLRRFRR